MSNKKNTPMQTLIEKLKELKKAKEDRIVQFPKGTEVHNAYSVVILTYQASIDEAESLLPIERQEFIDCYNEGYRDGESDRHVSDRKDISNFSNADNYFTNTFNQ